MEQTERVPASKVCAACCKDLPVEKYSRSARHKDGLFYRCRDCNAQYQSTYRKNNPARRCAWGRKADLKRYYGLSLDEYTTLLNSQGGVCAICATSNPGMAGSHKARNFSVDHDHATGEVRGLLCNNCNRGIGLLKDNPDVIFQAYTYLKK